jgi:LacI family transcriptional regulator
MRGEPGPKRPVTLDDVARYAGVSQPTASRVLNGSSRKVAESYRQRVIEAARQLGYTPNLPAQAMARGTSRTIALLVSLIADPYFSAMAAEIMKQAEAVGLHTSIAVTERQADRELDLVRVLRGQQPRAIILAGSGYIDPPDEQALVDELHRYQETGGRVVLVSRSDLPFETVDFDNHAGARQLARELARIGYRKCLVLGSGTPLLSIQQRVEGFLDGLIEEGVTDAADHVHHPDFSWKGAREFVLGLTDDQLRELQLVFAVTDDMALGALAGLRERGLRIPEDIGVAGFDDITTLRDVVPTLTTVHVDLHTLAKEAVHRAITPDRDLTRRPAPAYPVLRASTPPH